MVTQAVVDAKVPMSCHGYFASVNNSHGRGTNEVLTVDSTNSKQVGPTVGEEPERANFQGPGGTKR